MAEDYGARKAVHQDYAHHVTQLLGVSPVETIGVWCLYNYFDIPREWPSEATNLAVALSATQVSHLRASNPDRMPVEPRDLPSDIPSDGEEPA